MSESNYSTAGTSGNNFSPRELILRYLHYLPWIIISVALCLIGAWLKIRYTTPIYKVTAKLLVKDQNPYGGGDDKFQDIFTMSSGRENLNDEKEIIKSRPMAARVVKSLGLQLIIYNKGSIRNTLIRTEDAPFSLRLVQVQDSTNTDIL